MQVDADFHIHSRYSAATSKNMNLENISRQGRLKGLDLIGTGDCLHGKWLEDIRGLETFSEGIYSLNDEKFILTTEVEDSRRVHHLVLLPEISQAESLRESLSSYSLDLDTEGRPHLALRGPELSDFVRDSGGLMGPAHAFVPWTSMYKEYDCIQDCYGKNSWDINFLELGLSADTFMADHVKELQDLTFMTNSDAHSPWPNKLGREFNRLEVKDLTFRNIDRAIRRKGGNRFILNVGMDPRLGKYHRTACIKCFALYTLGDARKFRWKCPECGGRMKKGVWDRVEEISDYDEPRHPSHRPDYIRTAPLAEILAQSMKIKNPYSPKIQGAWKKLVGHFGSEIEVLIDAPMSQVESQADKETARLIGAFRKGDFSIIEGGGGKYGEIVFDMEVNPKKFYDGPQSCLDIFR